MPVRKNVDERRAELITLGVELFSTRSYEEVSIDDIAREAGVSKGLLYHYFGSKRVFYLECVRAAAAQLIAETEDDPSLPDSEHARAGLETYLSFVESHETAYIGLMRSGLGNDPEVAAVLTDTRDRFVQRMLLTMGIDPPRPVFRMAARCWIGQVEAACLYWLETRDVPRETLLMLLLGALYGTFAMAKHLDPEAPWDLPPPPPNLFS